MSSDERGAGAVVKPLAAWREERGLSQFQLAARTGVSLSTLSGIEGGRSLPRVDRAIKLAEALGITVEAIAWPKGEELTPPPSKAKRGAKRRRPPMANHVANGV